MRQAWLVLILDMPVIYQPIKMNERDQNLLQLSDTLLVADTLFSAYYQNSRLFHNLWGLLLISIPGSKNTPRLINLALASSLLLNITGQRLAESSSCGSEARDEARTM